MKIFSRKIDFDKDSFPHYPINQETAFAQITLENDNGMKVEILNYGCIIQSIQVLNKEAVPVNLVLSFENPLDYFTNPAYVGALIGRTAGRIGEGFFTLNDNPYFLNKNYGTTSAHGGNIGFDKKFFEFELETNNDRASVIFYNLSPNMEEGYPGNLRLKICYSLDNNNNLTLQYEADCDEDTLVNLTNHTYFHLNNDLSKDILSHELKIQSDYYAPIDERGVVTGEIFSLSDTPFDFRKSKEIGSDITVKNSQLEKGSGYDHYFIFQEVAKDIPNLILTEKSTDLRIELFTDCKGVVVYTQNFPIQDIPYKGTDLTPRHAIAIEPSQSPIGNQGEFIEQSLLKKGDIYRKYIKYHFSID